MRVRPIFLILLLGAAFFAIAAFFQLPTFISKDYQYGLLSLIREDDAQEVRMLAVGDMMLGRAVGRAHARGVDLFEKFRGEDDSFFKDFDIVIANLEGPITTSLECQPKELSFKFDPSVTQLISANGITHVNISNNHTYDCYSEGVIDTKAYLDSAGVFHMGGGPSASTTLLQEINGTRMAFVGIDITARSVDSEALYEHLRSLDEASDYTVIEIHWGNEYETVQSPSQSALAHGMIDAGADIIIGHHPHVVQPIEVYKGKLVFYSLGNFIFDQIGVAENTGIAIGLTVSRDDIEVELYPFTIEPHYQPERMPAANAQAYCSGLTDDLAAMSGNACAFMVAQP